MKRRPTGPRVRANKGTADALTLRSPRLSLTPSVNEGRVNGIRRKKPKERERCEGYDSG